MPETPEPADDDIDFGLHDDGYPSFDDIDFSRIYSIFRSVALFDDMYLSMQGMNIAVTDQVITAWEYHLLYEYHEIERTPTQSAVTVSAFSQMWIFALYELLRTWRQRVDDLNTHLKRGTLPTYIKSLETDDINPAASMRARQAERLLKEPDYMKVILGHQANLRDVFRMTEAIRMNLAKHELPKKGSQIPRAPGYGRINGLYGAMDYEVYGKGNTYTILSRRDIAEALRRVKLDDGPEATVQNPKSV